MTRKKITVDDVRRSFNRERGSSMPYSAIYFGRPLADILASLFYNAGWQANGVTLLRVGLSLLALLCVGTGQQALLYAGAGIALLAFVLDYVDGHLARLNDNATYWGKFSDGLGDYIFPALGVMAAGCGQWVQHDDGRYLLAGAVVSVVVMSVRVARDRLRYFELWMTSQSGTLTTEQAAKAALWRRREGRVAAFTADARTMALLLLFLPDGGMSFFVVLAALQAVTESLWLWYILKSGYATLNRWRRSYHAAA